MEPNTTADNEQERETLLTRVERLIEDVSAELSKAHHEKYDPQEAEKTAAKCLSVQKEISEFLSDAEIFSKERKVDVETSSADIYFEHRETFGKTEKKITEKALENLVIKDPRIVELKKAQIRAEAAAKKWYNLLLVFKDAHIFFRGLAKGKNEWS